MLQTAPKNKTSPVAIPATSSRGIGAGHQGCFFSYGIRSADAEHDSPSQPRPKGTGYSRTNSNKRGFTLIEMIVSVALFSFVMLAASAVLLSVIDANHKAQGIKATVDNLNFALESMYKELRVGSNYQCGGAGGGDCVQNGQNSITFKGHNGATITYGLDSANHWVFVARSDYLNGNQMPLTSPSELYIDRLTFYVGGTNPNNNKQPWVLLTIGGYINNDIGAKLRTRSRFDVETFVSARIPNVSRQ